MSAPLTPSQTVGPFFGVGLPFEKGEQVVPAGAAGSIRIEGQVLDGHGDPVPDALLEVWQPDEGGQYQTVVNSTATGFGRCRTATRRFLHRARGLSSRSSSSRRSHWSLRACVSCATSSSLSRSRPSSR